MQHEIEKAVDENRKTAGERADAHAAPKAVGGLRVVNSDAEKLNEEKAADD